MATRVLVAGVGNDLLGDDGFGIVALRRLAVRGLPPNVDLIETGIAGVALVQELVAGYDALIILDAAQLGVLPGTLRLLEVDVPDPAVLADDARRAVLADMHLAVPSTALILARALDALPPRVFILGCQPGDTNLGMALTPPVAAAAEAAVGHVLELIGSLTSSGQPAAAAQAVA